MAFRNIVELGRKTCLLAGVGAVCALLAAAPVTAAPLYQFSGTINVPVTAANTTGTFIGYDLSTFDATDQLYYLTDRSNNGIDVFSAKTNSFVTQIGSGLFTGNVSPAGGAGPNGISITTLGNGDRLLLAGNGASNFVEFNLAPNGTSVLSTQTISTAIPGTPVPQNRVDGVAFAPTANTILAANNASNPGFITLVNNATGAVIKSLQLNGQNGTPDVGGNGVESVVYNTARNSFFVAVPSLNAAGTDPGGVIEVSATTGLILNTYSFAALSGGAISSCNPTGAAQGIGDTIIVACSNGGTQSLILEPSNATLQTIAGVSGSDELAYDPTRGVAFESARYEPGGPVLGVIDAATATYTQGLTSSYNSHSVAVDPVSGEVFVALDATSATGTDPICPAGCIGVYTPVPEPPTFRLMAAALVVTGLVFRRRFASVDRV